MIYPTNRVGKQPYLWLLFILRLRKCLKIRYLLILFIFLIFSTYLRIINHAPPNETVDTNLKQEERILVKNSNLKKCNFDETESILRYQSPIDRSPNSTNGDRPQPTIERLKTLFRILISYENKYRDVFNYLNIFRLTDIANTLKPYANNSERLDNIYCHFQRYITISDNGHIDISPHLINYLKQVSIYLSDGFKSQHLNWNQTSTINRIQKPVIILSANAQFFETLQASMRTVNTHLKDHTIAIYNLGFNENQLNLIKSNCPQCLIIPFPFDLIRPVANHIGNLGSFAWKPIVIQDAVQRFGSIIYGDTSVRYRTSNFDKLLIDNLIRGFSCRELPGHYLPCFTLGGTFTWFNETPSTFFDVYIAEAGFVAVTDNFLSRLILKTWVTCALDVNCIAPSSSQSKCRRGGQGTNIHRYDQSAMVVVLSFYFFPSPRLNDKTDPAPYDMYSSIQAQIAEVRRFEGEKNFFTQGIIVNVPKNSSTIIALKQ